MAHMSTEKEPQTQGFGLHYFDVVIAANVLHATANLKESLAHTRAMLRPGGLLILLEVLYTAEYVG